MQNCRSTASKGIFNGIVLANKQVRDSFYRLVLDFSGPAAKAFAATKPGQFAQLDLSTTALPPAEEIPEKLLDASSRKILLRRPFSFCNVAVDGNKTLAGILYCVIGPSTLRMTTLSNGDSLSIIGPLGNGFSISQEKTAAVLVVGGMGAGPLQHLANVLSTDFPDTKLTVLAGAKSKEHLPFESDKFADGKMDFVVSTDDGSFGYSGLVTDCLLQWLEKSNLAARDIVIYSCGPEIMLAKVAQIAKQQTIDCQISMERQMACGFGFCQSCAVECKVQDSNETIYKMCCKDGPVFDSREIVFSK